MADKYAVQKNQEFADINDIDTDLHEEEEEDGGVGSFKYAKMSEAEKKHAWDCFKFFDKDNNDKLDKKEVITAMRAVGLNPTKNDVDRIVKQLDENENGFIDFDEFKQLLVRSWRSVKENQLELVAAFRIFDINKDGYVSQEELVKVLTSFGEKMTEDEAREYISMVDSNGDGKLNYQEFVHLMAGHGSF